MGYAIPMRISDEFVHQTGPPASGEPKVERLVAIIGGHVVGEPIRTSEHVLLEKGNYLSHFYDYKYASTGVKGAATRDKQKLNTSGAVCFHRRKRTDS
jgi:hypothetical protein